MLKMIKEQLSPIGAVGIFAYMQMTPAFLPVYQQQQDPTEAVLCKWCQTFVVTASEETKRHTQKITENIWFLICFVNLMFAACTCELLLLDVAHGKFVSSC